MNEFEDKVIEESKTQSGESLKATYERVRLDFRDVAKYPNHANANIQGILPTQENMKTSQVIVNFI